MSVVTVQIGQCGNQIGEKLFETLANDCFEYRPPSNIDKTLNSTYVNDSKRRFFAESSRMSDSHEQALLARSILIDMESKVVNRLVSTTYGSSSTQLWKFRAQNSYTQKKGSGNNWSYGYCVNGPKSKEKIEEIVRHEAERCDRLAAFHVCMSLAGGTGSGVGTYYSQLLKTLYPRTVLVNTLVWPFSQGEVILQNYNLLLTLNKIYQCSDGLILLENDSLHQACKRVQAGAAKKELTFDDLNALIAHRLASVLQPACDELNTHNYLDEVISDLCAHNDYKMLTLNSVPHISSQSIEFSSFQWPGLYKSARVQVAYPTSVEAECQSANEIRTLGMSLFARGGGGGSNNVSEWDIKEHCQLRDSHFESNRFGTGSIRLWHNRRGFNRHEKSLSVLSNGQGPALKIEQLVSKAWRMFNARAYVHQYTRYDSFEEY